MNKKDCNCDYNFICSEECHEAILDEGKRILPASAFEPKTKPMTIENKVEKE